MNNGLSYEKFYEILLHLREEFHKTGRLDDSNAKLDEILKLLLTSYCLAKKGIRLDLKYVREVALKHFNDESKVAAGLKIVFNEVSCGKEFLNDDGTNIFGDSRELAIHDNEDNFAEILIVELSKIDFLNLLKSDSGSNFDVVNECFGHFVRENFRNNKEDGQYMTPAEVSKYLGKIISYELFKEGNGSDILKNLVMLDPTCGVGTLLIETFNSIQDYCLEHDLLTDALSLKECSIYGQDKVDRMVRMSKINMMLENINMNNIHIGNSIVGESFLDTLSGKVNLIISNPPFGAEFDVKDLNLKYYPFVASVSDKYKTVKSEVLILDRSLNMLKKDGLLAIVLPDGVVSSKGIYSDLRDYLLKNYEISWVIDLPSVTFAQAGTRTNTSIVLIRKRKPADKLIKMLSIKDVGYDVKERVGVPVKILCGENELTVLENIFDLNFNNEIIFEKPSLVQIKKASLISNILKPSFYDAQRIKSFSEYISSKSNVHKLSEYVISNNSNRKSYLTNDEIKHISVLHVDKNGIIDFDEVEKFVPICKGREVYEGDVLFSKLNPRISRVCVVPKYHHRLVCSNEFEIFEPKDKKYRFLLCYFLKTDFVLKQIETFTAGTSSSHSRIQREQLLEVVVPDFDKLIEEKKIAQIEEKMPSVINSIYSEFDYILKSIETIDKFSRN